jgi:hypothetical protein
VPKDVIQAILDEELPLDLTDDLRRRGFPHLRVRRRRGLIVVESGPAKAPFAHARFRQDTVHLWRLEMPDGDGRWQTTPYRALLDALLDTLIDDFPWTLAAVHAKPSRTSGRKY